MHSHNTFIKGRFFYITDMIVKLGQVLTPSLRCLQLIYMFINNNMHPQLIKMCFSCSSKYLIDPSRYVYEAAGFDGPMRTHVLKCV